MDFSSDTALAISIAFFLEMPLTRDNNIGLFSITPNVSSPNIS